MEKGKSQVKLLQSLIIWLKKSLQDFSNSWS